MAGPMNVTLYPPLRREPLPNLPEWKGWDDWKDRDNQARYEFSRRRATAFTGAELAAEYWSAVVRADPDAATFRRFASTPSYWEDED